MRFSLSKVPDIQFGINEVDRIGDHAMSLCSNGKAAIIMDGFLAQSGLGDRMVADLAAAGILANIYSEFSGEPKLAHIDAAGKVAEGASLVIGIGGGSALDIAKIAACTVASGKGAMHYALAANPLPKNALSKIMIPTTAGTGSETSATNIFAGPEGKKLWIWGPEAKSDLVILDPVLTVSLPANMTAWCGLDALVHAFEASTNRNANPAGKMFGHEALRLLVGSLETAVETPADLTARGNVLLGSCYAGAAIDNCGTAIAHNISHALAGLAPVHHGFATALGFEVTLPWLVEADTDDLNEAARACGLKAASELPGFISDLMDRCGIVRKLPDAFGATSVEALAGEMRAPENQPMRKSTIRDITDADIDRIAAAMMALK